MDFNNVDTIRFAIDSSIMFLIGSMWFGAVVFLRLKKNKNFVYLVFFTIFFVYIVKVLDYTLFQFQSLLLLKQFMPNLILNGQGAGESINLIPIVTLTGEALQTSLLNILLLIPFGFGLPFITPLRMKWVVVVGALFSIAIECLQLVTGLMANITFRIADINDVIFNTLGVVAGYVLFIGLVRICRRLFPNAEMRGFPILRYIAKRPQVDK